MSKIQYMRDDAEEILNSITHAITLGISVVFTAFLVKLANESQLQIWPFYLFGASMSLTFFASVLYHGCLDPVLKSKMRIFDLISIFIAIAGGFVSFYRIMLPTEEFLLYSFLSVLVACACIYTKFKIFKNSNSFWPSLGVYLVAGWSNILFLLDTNYIGCADTSMLLIGGGLVYTVGSVFYMYDYKRYFHTIWHLCATCGFLLHVAALLKVV